MSDQFLIFVHTFNDGLSLFNVHVVIFQSKILCYCAIKNEFKMIYINIKIVWDASVDVCAYTF